MDFFSEAYAGDWRMNNKSVEIDILRNKLNNSIRFLDHSSTVQCNEDLSKDERMRLIYYYLDKLSGCQKVTVDPKVLTRKKGLFGKMVLLFKRLARKIVAWYLQPVCDDQTRYNQQAYQTMVEMNALLIIQAEKSKMQAEESKKQWEELRQMIKEEREKMNEKNEERSEDIEDEDCI